MIPFIKNITKMVVLLATLQSCNQAESLQQYYVDHQEQPNFLSLDVPLSMLNLDLEQLSQDQQDAYKSIQKLNMLAFKANPENAAEFDLEMAKVKTILNNSKYEELMRGGNPEDGSFVIKVLGKGEAIQEFVLFGTMDDKGFAIVRVLGKKMDPNKLMTLAPALSKANLETSSLSQFKAFFE